MCNKEWSMILLLPKRFRYWATKKKKHTKRIKENTMSFIYSIITAYQWIQAIRNLNWPKICIRYSIKLLQELKVSSFLSLNNYPDV